MNCEICGILLEDDEEDLCGGCLGESVEEIDDLELGGEGGEA